MKVFQILEHLLLSLFLIEQVLTDENKILRQEIKRLKEDNTRLIRQTKQAMSERDQVLVSTIFFAYWVILVT